MKAITVLGILVLSNCVVGPPVKPAKNKADEAAADNETKLEDQKLGLQYEKYLKEVVGLLEKDDKFRQKLEEANITDVKSGKIAQHLNILAPDIRTRLDELKREEIIRLNDIRKLIDFVVSNEDRRREGVNLPNGVERMIQSARAELRSLGVDSPQDYKDHVDLSDEDFKEEDLRKLIVKASADLENIDERRKDEFKKYEMEKERLRRDKLKQMNDIERANEEKQFEEMQQKHNEHPKLNHPGSRDQLEEVWEEDDGLDPKDFDPKSFFFLHDTNSDGVLDEVEVEALFQKELDKVYDVNATEDDINERYEEMNRMREHVYSEVDSNKDRLIDLQEFLKSTQANDFNKNEGWDPIDQKEVFTDEELAAYEKQRLEELRRQMFEGDVAPGEIPLPRAVSDTVPQEHRMELDGKQNIHHEEQNIQHHEQNQQAQDGQNQPVQQLHENQAPQHHDQPQQPVHHENQAQVQAEQHHDGNQNAGPIEHHPLQGEKHKAEAVDQPIHVEQNL